MKNSIRDGCNVIETISVLKFQQVQGSMQRARRVAVDQIAYQNEARGLESLKILGAMKVQSVTELLINLILQAVT